MKRLRDLFLNEKAILFVIILNSILLFLQESGVTAPFISTLDVACTIIFVIEMVVKLCVYGVKKYWESGWNRLDGILVILSIPSLIVWFMPNVSFDLSFLLASKGVEKYSGAASLNKPQPIIANIMIITSIPINTAYDLFIATTKLFNNRVNPGKA